MPGLTVAYITTMFPHWGGGMRLNEVRAIERAGVELAIFSHNRPPADLEAQPGMKEWVERTTYLPRGTDRACVRAGLRFLLRSPWGFLRGVYAALRVGGRISHRRHIMELFDLASRMKKAGARHVHAHQADEVADTAMAAAACLGLPFSFAGHARDIYTNPGRLAVKIGAAAFVATCTAFNERYLKDVCSRSGKRGVDPSKIVRVYHGVDLERFQYRKSTGSRTRLISVARLKQKKGFTYLLDALAVLKDRHRDVHLDIYGEGDQKAVIAEHARARGLEDRVALRGAIEHHRIPSALAESGLFVLACVVTADQDRDGIPNSIVEAMASGTPVVSTGISGIPEIIEDGATGLLVPERDADALADAIERMITDEELGERCRRQGRAVVEARFSLRTTGVTLARLFRAACKESPEPATAP